MEERDPLATSDDHNHDDHNHDHNHDTSNKEDILEEEFDDYYNIKHEKNVARKDKDDDDNDEMQVIPSNNPPHETYIIQIPKDQIYRVPPPENAEIVERYRNPVQTNQKGRRRCLYWSLSILFVAAFIVSIVFCVHHFTLKPKNPTFSVKHLAIKHPNSTSSKKSKSPEFQVSLEIMNPNNVNDIGYQQGSATLAYKGKEIGHGSFPALQNEESGKSDEVDVILSGLSKGSLPKELEPQPLKKTKPLNLNLSMSIPLNMKSWLYNKIVEVKVGCDFEVNSLGDNIKVLSQKCDVHK